MEGNKKIQDTDWEWDPKYCHAEEKKELSLEDFIEEEAPEADDKSFSDARLARTIEDVRAVLKLAGQGHGIGEISEILNLDQQYVYNIQVCAQGFREDDEIAVAHLVMME